MEMASWINKKFELGLNPTSVDSDGDSMDDGEEVKEGLDPSDDSDCPRWYCGSSGKSTNN